MRSFDIESEGQREYLVKFLSRQVPPFHVEFGPLIIQRTLSQNSRLWLLHKMAGDHLGYSAEEMHELALCHHFGYNEARRTDPITGEIVVQRVPIKRSSARTKHEFREFMDATETWYGTEFGCWLPA